MGTVPADTPVTTPVAVTVAVAVVPLLHTPPDVTSLKVVVAPVHTVLLPVIAEGSALTVTGTLVLQPVLNV